MTQENARGGCCPKAVAERILAVRGSQGIDTTPMHVLKLAYLCHGWMLGIHGRSLIHEDVVAWQYGPVVPTIYHLYKSFGGGRIQVPLEGLDRVDAFDAEQQRLMDAVLRAYQGYSALDLSAITHQPGTPWSIVYADGRGKGAVIPNALIQQHYAARYRQRVNSAA